MNQSPIYRVHHPYVLAASQTPVVGTRVVPFGVFVVRIVASQDSWITIKPNPTPAIGYGTFMPAGYVEYFEVGAGDRIGFVTDSANTANINVDEMTR